MRYPFCPKCQLPLMSKGIDQYGNETFYCPDHGFHIRTETTPLRRFIVRKRINYQENDHATN